jgi:hypothetical protein
MGSAIPAMIAGNANLLMFFKLITGFIVNQIRVRSNGMDSYFA